MIRNRHFMFGLGTGLISGALLLQLMISGGAAPLTKEEVVKEAARLNLTVTDNAAKSQEDAEGVKEAPGVTEPAAGAPSPGASPVAVQPSAANAPQKPAVPSKPAATAAVKPKSTNAPVKSPASPAAPEAAANGAITVQIPTGITLYETADLLAEAGVVKDKNKFLQVANSRKVNKIIKYGSYSFNNGENINSIIDKLITVK